MVSAFLLAALLVQGETAAPRKEFVACLHSAVAKAQDSKMKPASFEPLARSMCAAQISAFRLALIAYDRKSGSPRGQAEADADAQIGDYVTSSSEKLDSGD